MVLQSTGLLAQFKAASPSDILSRLLSAIVGDVAALPTPPGLSTVILVDAGATSPGQRGTLNPFATIGAALAVAQQGDTIRIAPGAYNETITIPNVNALTLVGLGRVPQEVTITSAAAQGVVEYTAPADPATPIDLLTLENMQLVSTAPALVSATFACEANSNAFLSRPGLVLRHVRANGLIALRRVALFELDECIVRSPNGALSLLGVGEAHLRFSLLEQQAPTSAVAYEYLSPGFALEPGNGRVGVFFQSTKVTGRVRLAGAVALQVDRDSAVSGGVDTNGGLATSGTTNPYVGLHGLFGFPDQGAPPLGGTGVTPTLVNLLFNNAPTTVGTETAAWGCDLSDARIYCGTLINLAASLAAPQEPHTQVLRADNMQVASAPFHIVTPSGAVNRYRFTCRGCDFGNSAFAPGVICDGSVDLDARGCVIYLTGGSVLNTAAIDRDTTHVPQTVVGAGAVPVTFAVPYPTYVAANYGIIENTDAPAIGPVGFSVKSETGFTYTASSSVGHIDFTIVRAE